MPSAKFNEVYAKTREIKSGPSNDELLDVCFDCPILLKLGRWGMGEAEV